MPRLMLLRHAKSSWDDSGLADFDRPLSSRGRKAVPLMARHMAGLGLSPQKIVSSTALRCRETLAGLLPFFAQDAEVRLTRDLYEASEDRCIDVIRAQGGSLRSLMLIGHNPGLQDVAVDLVGSGDPSLVDDMREKFPTAALAVIDFEARRWVDVEPKTGRIVAFVRPRDLDAVDSDVTTDEDN